MVENERRKRGGFMVQNRRCYSENYTGCTSDFETQLPHVFSNPRHDVRMLRGTRLRCAS